MSVDLPVLRWIFLWTLAGWHAVAQKSNNRTPGSMPVRATPVCSSMKPLAWLFTWFYCQLHRLSTLACSLHLHVLDCDAVCCRNLCSFSSTFTLRPFSP